jgi:glycine dehydrogenase subunit 2
VSGGPERAGAERGPEEPAVPGFAPGGEEAMTIYERSRPGRRAFVAPAAEVPETPLDELIPATERRSAPPALPEVSEPEIVRHYNNLSKQNFDLDTGFYPLGSCTMKHNPKVNERVAALPGHARLHPAQDPEYAQGALELMWRLQCALAEVAASCSPAPTTTTGGRSAPRCSPPTPPTGPTRRPFGWRATRS